METSETFWTGPYFLGRNMVQVFMGNVFYLTDCTGVTVMFVTIFS